LVINIYSIHDARSEKHQVVLKYIRQMKTLIDKN